MMIKLLTFLILKLIKIYKLFFSPILGKNCRFEPTCSHYCEAAIKQHGLAKGLMLFLKRLGKCHPWGSSGYDPVPEDND